MKLTIKISLTIIVIARALLCDAQEVPTVGKPMPYFELNNVRYYKKSTFNSDDLKTKWTLLSFWAPSCGACIHYLEKANKLQVRFATELNVVLVGINRDINRNVATAYEKIRAKKHLNLISTYDSALSIQWDIHSVPQIIVINPEGVVRAITSSEHITEKNIAKLLEGEQVFFKDKAKPSKEYDPSTFPGSQENTLVYRSILTKAKDERATVTHLGTYITYPIEYRKDGFVATRIPLAQLYMIAYTGGDLQNDSFPNQTFYHKPVVTVRDSSLFDVETDSAQLFNYNLAVPPEKSGDIQYILKVFQNELRNAFGFNVTIEDRLMPVMVLTSSNKNDLKSAGGERSFYGNETFGTTGFKVRNYPINDFLKLISGYLRWPGKILNESNINHNIDIDLDADMNSFDDVNKKLAGYGLKLSKAKRAVKVIVISDNLQ